MNKYKVQVSTDGSSFKDVDGGKQWVGNKDRGSNGDIKKQNTFASPVAARYVRWVVSEWHGHMSMRAGIVTCKGPSCSGSKEVVPDYSACKASLAHLLH